MLRIPFFSLHLEYPSKLRWTTNCWEREMVLFCLGFAIVFIYNVKNTSKGFQHTDLKPAFAIHTWNLSVGGIANIKRFLFSAKMAVNLCLAYLSMSFSSIRIQYNQMRWKIKHCGTMNYPYVQLYNQLYRFHFHCYSLSAVHIESISRK